MFETKEAGFSFASVFKRKKKLQFSFIPELQAKRLQLDGGERGDRADRKRKSRFGDEEDIIPEKTLIPMVIDEILIKICFLNVYSRAVQPRWVYK